MPVRQLQQLRAGAVGGCAGYLMTFARAWRVKTGGGSRDVSVHNCKTNESLFYHERPGATPGAPHQLSSIVLQLARDPSLSWGCPPDCER